MSSFQLMRSDDKWNIPFMVAVMSSGLCGIAISFCSLWCLYLTSPTTYSMVGAFNKLPTALIGLLFFDKRSSFVNSLSIAFGKARMHDSRDLVCKMAWALQFIIINNEILKTH